MSNENKSLINSNSNHTLYLRCNQQAEIVELIRDDLGILDQEAIPCAFLSLFNEESKSNAAIFWQELMQSELTLDTELLVKCSSGKEETLKFSGGMLRGQVWIIAKSNSEMLESMIEEFMRMNNEQQNLIRMAEKNLSKLKREDNNNVELYNEISQVNNELVNAQRKLAKQNEQIRQLNIELQSTNHELEQFAYSLSHDLKEPLRMVRSFMSQLRKKYEHQLDERARKYIHFAVDGADRMNQYIMDLLDYSRIGRAKGNFEMTDFNELLNQVQAFNRSSITANNVEINFSDLPTLPCLRMPIKQLFNNLISNSIKYRNENTSPVINISFEEKSNHWKFSFKDNGPGIAPENHAGIFELFNRIDDLQKKTDGTGIGLAICKKVVQAHQGEIWVESALGAGSTFFFTISKELIV